jgi:SAM-dependent methyltransferase
MGMTQVEFRRADMEKLDFDDGAFDAVVSVFSIFFVPDMVSQVRQLWRCVRPGGQLAITTWGPRMFEPGSSIWWNAVGQVRPDLLTAFKPWERITTPDTLEGLLIDSGIRGAAVVPEEGRQPLAHPDDWWTVILGSGYRWTVDQMSADDARDVRRICDDILHRQAVSAIETNVVYAVATRM